MELHGSILEIASVIGREKALYLVGSLTGKGKRPWRLNLYIPRNPRNGHPLVRILGMDDALKMAGEFGGMNLQPSNGNAVIRCFRTKEARRLRAEGLLPKDIADILQVTRRTVLNLLERNSPEG